MYVSIVRTKLRKSSFATDVLFTDI